MPLPQIIMIFSPFELAVSTAAWWAHASIMNEPVLSGAGRCWAFEWKMKY